MIDFRAVFRFYDSSVAERKTTTEGHVKTNMKTKMFLSWTARSCAQTLELAT